MNLSSRYDHTQWGWVILGTSLLPAGLLFPLTAVPETRLALSIVSGLMVLLIVLFATLRVLVDDSALVWRFGIGLIGGRIDLAEVYSFRQVENPWYWGWGVRRFPGGKLYNVSGFHAVELVLRDGRRIRVGTDEPVALFAAIREKLGEPIASAEWPHGTPTRPVRTALFVGVTLLTVPLCLGWVMTRLAQAPVVTVSHDGLVIDNPFYGQTYAGNEIRRVQLVPTLPRVRLRTNGYAANGTLRGWFLLDRIGKAKLFVQLDRPPFILIELERGYVGVNLREPAETRRLFDEIRSAMPQVVAP